MAAARLPKPPGAPAYRTPLGRRLRSAAFRGAAGLALLAALAALLTLVVHVVAGALPALSLTTLTTPTVGAAGGVANALVGTVWLAMLTLLAVVPVGVGAAIFIVEYAPPRWRSLVLLASDVLAGVPSIVFGYVGYLTFVLAFGWGFSALAAALTLALVVLPYLVRNVAQGLQQVPDALREQGLALGWSRARVIWHVTAREARGSIATGTLLATGVAMGETAPLLYTADWSQQYPAVALTHHAVGYLTYMVWAYSQEPFPQSVALAYVAALLLILLVGAVSVAARLRGATLVRGGVSQRAKEAERRA
jgi:phosphate transport system permease protein